MNRRDLLKTSLLGFALPTLETFAGKVSTKAKASRLVCIGHWLGIYTPEFFPKMAGENYEITKLLKPLEHLKNDFSVFSGLDHRFSHGHKSWNNFLCGTDARTVSLDQVVADEIGQDSRYKSLPITCGRKPAESAMNVTESGIILPMINRPTVLFNKLFSSSTDIKRLKYELESGRSVLDSIHTDLKVLQQKVSKNDKSKLDDYVSAVRGVEENLTKRKFWLDKPIKKIDFKMPRRDPMATELLFECEKLMFDLMALAFESDSTKVATYLGPGDQQVFRINGELLSTSYHGLSHHGNNSGSVKDFLKINFEHMKNLAYFIGKLKECKDAYGRELLDSTIVYFGSGLGNGNTHSTSNVPVLVAGGGFKHGAHHKIDRERKYAPVLGQLFATMMQQLGMKNNSFANAKGNMNQYLVRG